MCFGLVGPVRGPISLFYGPGPAEEDPAEDESSS